MTIIKQNNTYTATAQVSGCIITKVFSDLEQARYWLQMQYGMLNLPIRIEEL